MTGEFQVSGKNANAPFTPRLHRGGARPRHNGWRYRGRGMIASRFATGYVAALCVATVSAFGQSLQLSLDTNRLNIYGHSNAYARLEQSDDLAVWSPTGSVFHVHSNLDLPCENSQNTKFFRSIAAPSNWVSINNSLSDVCAEHDNVSVLFVGQVTNYSITATHPMFFTPSDCNCASNFENCPAGTNVDYQFANPTVIEYQGDTWAKYSRLASWWRDQGMTASYNGVFVATNVHQIDIGKKIPGFSSWPGYFTIYSDGYVRLIPFPPESFSSVCMGASIILGPSEPSDRPYSDIASVDVRVTNNTLFVAYRSGGTAIVDFAAVSRTSATLRVSANYPTDKPFCTIRTMFVSNGNSDCDSVIWQNDSTTTTNNIMDFRGGSGTNWFFCRRYHSIQRDSAPDIRIVF